MKHTKVSVCLCLRFLKNQNKGENKNNCMGLQDGSVSKGACCQVCPPESNPWDLYGEKRINFYKLA